MNTNIISNTIIDLGCGPNKVTGAYGVDMHPYPGVNQVFSLDQYPWPLQSNTYKKIYARHIIEHIADIPAFINEIHRIATNDAIVNIITPHFSSLHSWEDPTHRWHLACGWHKTFTQRYMSEQTLSFDHIQTDIGFSKSLRGVIGKLTCKILGTESWEKHYAFILRGKNITTYLKVVKKD